MSGLAILAPIGLVGLIGLPLVIIFHMRHTTPVVRPVPTLRFWLAALQEQTEQANFRRPPLSLLLLLHLLIVGLLASALTRPVTTRAWGGLGQRTEPRHLIILLDGSTSMTATDTPSGRTRYDEARQHALARLRGLHEGDVATVVLLGTHTTTLQGTDAASLKAIRDRLGDLDLPGGRADLNAALGLTKDLVLPHLDDRVVLISDGALTLDPTVVSQVGAPIELDRVGGATTGNIAITDLAARPSPRNPAQQQLYVRIANFGDPAKTVPVDVTADAVAVAHQDVPFNPNDNAAEFVRDLPAGAAKVTVKLASTDALMADNSAALVLLQDKELALRVLLISDAPTALQRALFALPGAQLTTEGTDSAAAATNRDPYDLVVYEGFAPPASALPHAPILFVNPPEDGLLPTRGVMQSPTVLRVRAEDPLLRGVELAGVTFGQTPVHVLDATETDVVGAEAGPLVYRGTVPGTGEPMVVLPFNVTQSNLPQRVAFPILIANIAGYLAPSPLPSSVPLGDPLRYRPRADAAVVRVVPPIGVQVDLPLAANGKTGGGGQADGKPTAGAAATADQDRLREVAFADTGRPGEYQVIELNGDGKQLAAGHFVVNAGHPRESDLRTNPDLPGNLAAAKAGADVGSRRSLSDWWPALVAAALAVLLLEWLWAVAPHRRGRRSIAAVH